MSSNLVESVISNNEMAEALVAAIACDNPDAQMYIGGRGGYICIHTEQYCQVTRESLEPFLSHLFELSQMELAIVAFAGTIRFGDEEIVWDSEN